MDRSFGRAAGAALTIGARAFADALEDIETAARAELLDDREFLTRRIEADATALFEALRTFSARAA